jgi:hypothetical protein
VVPDLSGFARPLVAVATAAASLLATP